MNRGYDAGPVAVIILAAGGSRRLGRPKQLLPYKGRSLLRHAVEAAMSSAADYKLVVLGSGAESMKKDIVGLAIQTVVNDRWSEGMSTSIRAAVRSVPSSMDAALFMLCDQPKVTNDLINRMIVARMPGGTQIVACRYAETLGVPALFPRHYFAELSALRGDAGAKSVILNHMRDVVGIPFPAGSVDIDTQEDYDTSDYL